MEQVYDSFNIKLSSDCIYPEGIVNEAKRRFPDENVSLSYNPEKSGIIVAILAKMHLQERINIFSRLQRFIEERFGEELC